MTAPLPEWLVPPRLIGVREDKAAREVVRET